MSSFLYGAMTTRRLESDKDKSEDEQPPGVKTYTDMLASLVPAEVLALHAAIIGLTTTTENAGTESQSTVINDRGALALAFAALVLMSIAVYVAGRLTTKSTGSNQRGRWEKLDNVRMFIPPVALVAWMLLTHPSAWDGLGIDIPGSAMEGVIAVILAVALSLLAKALAYKADQTEQAPS